MTSATLSLLAAEFAARRWFPAELAPGRIRGLYRADSELGYTLAPGVSLEHDSPFFRVDVTTNSLGMRDTELLPRSADRPRVLVLGDSHTWGWGVPAEETFCSRLEQALGWEVVAAGVPGYSNYQELGLLRRLVAPLAPDLVMIAVTLENDAWENRATREPGALRLVERDGYLVNPEIPRWSIASLKRELRRTLRLYGLVVDRLHWLSGSIGDPDHNLPHFGLAPMFSVRAGEVSAELSEMAEVLDRAAALANGRWPLIVALIPFPSMLDDAAWIRACAWSRIALERCDRGLPARFLGEALAGRARVVDLLPALRAQADASDAPFIPSEGHLSARGHRLVAQALEPILAAALSSPVVD